MTRKRSREDAQRHGQRAERLAILLLRLKFYRILARRWRSPLGEIDIVARRGSLVAIVEVKARGTSDGAAEALGPQQRARIGRAAALFLGRHPELAGCALRYDVMLVLPWRLPLHLRGAWIEPG